MQAACRATGKTLGAVKILSEAKNPCIWLAGVRECRDASLRSASQVFGFDDEIMYIDKDSQANDGDQQFEQVLGPCSFVASAVMPLGGIVYLARRGAEVPNYHVFKAITTVCAVS